MINIKLSVINNRKFKLMENTVNERVKLLRSFLNLTQNDFATKVKSTLVTISRIENGSTSPRKSLLFEIVRVYGVSESWLFNNQGEMFIPGTERKDLVEPTNWKEEAFAQLKNHNETLKQEIEWLKSLVSKMAGSPNFLNGIDLVGMMNPVNTMSVAA